MREIWKEIVGWEGLYEISDWGRVRSLDRIAYATNGDSRCIKGRVLKTSPAGNGYPRCNFHREGKKFQVTVHLLVAAAFHGARPPGEEVRHRDGNRGNPRANNLCYGTRSQNHMDKIVHGTMVRGHIHPFAKLTETDVEAIRAQYASSNVSQDELGKIYGVSQTTIGRAIRGDCWGWLR